MKTPSSFLCLLSSVACCLAQPQEAWVARYNGGFTNQTHTPLAMALDASGNIFVAGTSQNASNVNDYVVLKYTPSGQQLWAARHSSTNGTDFTLKGFTLDRNGNTHLTGTGSTLKLDGNGMVDWTAPYAGNDVAVDTNGNVYVTGFSTVQYATVKLDAAGSNHWVRTYANGDAPGVWPTESQKVAVDEAGRVYVAGWEAWGPTFRCSAGRTNLCRYYRPSLLAYETAGSCLWTNAYTGSGINWGETVGLLLGNQGDLYLIGTDQQDAFAVKLNPSGQNAWGQHVGGPLPPLAGITLDPGGNAYVSGAAYLAAKLGSMNGEVVWGIYQYASDFAAANGIALDNLASVYIAGISTCMGTGNDIATIKYDTNGNQQWVIRYNGPANGNDGGTAIAVAPDGSIYVTGFSANESGGTDIVLIKYAALTNIQKEPDGSVQLQFFGTPGTNYTFQSATNLLNWADLGSVLADTNGLFQFTDTNAPLFPYRFYRWYVP